MVYTSLSLLIGKWWKWEDFALKILIRRHRHCTHCILQLPANVVATSREVRRPNGLYMGHAYSITALAVVKLRCNLILIIQNIVNIESYWCNRLMDDFRFHTRGPASVSVGFGILGDEASGTVIGQTSKCRLLSVISCRDFTNCCYEFDNLFAGLTKYEICHQKLNRDWGL